MTVNEKKIKEGKDEDKYKIVVDDTFKIEEAQVIMTSTTIIKKVVRYIKVMKEQEEKEEATIANQVK